MNYKIHTYIGETTIGEETINTDGTLIIDLSSLSDNNLYNDLYDKVEQGILYITDNNIVVENSISVISKFIQLSIDKSSEQGKIIDDLSFKNNSDKLELTAFKIYDLIPDSIKNKKANSINYKTELKDGVTLHPVYNIGNDGLIVDTTYYNNYVDSNNVGEEILKVIESYQTDLNEPIKSAKTVQSRIKQWRYKKKDNTEEILKNRNKIYDTFDKQNKEGTRRRQNIINQAKVKIATALVLTGQSPDSSDATIKLVELFEEYQKSFTTYEKSGKGSVYNDLLNDITYLWLDVVVQDDVNTQYMIPEMIGMSIRSYSIEKLKGNI